MRRAKIVNTLGPAVESHDGIKELIEAGMNVARLNMSHGDYPEHQKRLDLVRSVSAELGINVAALADLQGPKIRTGVFAKAEGESNGKIVLKKGDKFTITTDDIIGNQERVSTTFKGLPGDCHAGDTILIDDGNIQLEVESVTDTDVNCICTVPGPVSDHKGINLPGVPVSLPAMTEKDEENLRWALGVGIDLVALSFVRHGDDIERVHQIMDEEGRRVPVIAKLEKPQAIENLDSIIDNFDAVMVARGDMAVECPLEEVPLIQKTIIEKARLQAKPVIVATQMLESMIHNPRPTRAEAADVANAILDGADGVMTSAETSVGAYPGETVRTMAKIVESTEAHGLDKIAPIAWDPHTTGGIISKAATEVAERAEAKYLVSFTKSGDTARRLSRLRPSTPMLVFTPDETTTKTLAWTWGAQAIVTPVFQNSEELYGWVNSYLRDNNLVAVGERVVVVSGSPMDVPGKTNDLRVLRIKEG
ncbi:Pyruvate kinase [Acidipropionibacterium acidipropionici ATCC 4875]|uniref:Pyruvate kinase n=1 Tax=Acidipropionibacterium acidipropionici (strain ATCC 4875 / DSM 20272 / JCM 6432 / NBRC 12425 / NCIMB 8070 / 4) TaxID=1171373 RepID=K7RVV4_ACIA4|nr:pyruvate kinase [Acidipropionibacterium acidipropionici]AFV89118.1 Pyruvate kinase [Acidipropionibacterium acidipropionici ATCC 4875]APZ07942.1 pyruvate kinase [Acidipropionibacterium acidipropionici]